VDRSISGAAPFVATNVAGVQVLLQACLDAGVGPVVHVSTDEVYGSVESGSWTEQAPLAPNSPYSAAKAGGDLIARAYARTYGWTCGSPAAATTTAPTSTRRRSSAVRDQPARRAAGPAYGDGGNIRGWIPPPMTLRGIQLVLERARPGQTYHINATPS